MRNPKRRYARIRRRVAPRSTEYAAKRSSDNAVSGLPVEILPVAISNRAMQRQLQKGIIPAGLLLRYGRDLGSQNIRRLLARQNQPGRPPSFPLVQRLPEGQPSSFASQAEIKNDTVTGSASDGFPPPANRRMIRYGSTGNEVSYAQERLNAHGATPPLAVDGIFGPLTRQATVGYQNSHGLVPDAIIGPRTWASLDGPTKLGGSSGAGPGGGAGGPGSKVMLYDTGSQTFNPPTSGTKMSDIRDQIKAKQDIKPNPELGKTVNAVGVTSGTDEEIFVWNILLQRAERKFWGSEVDVVTTIGPSPKGGPAPKGQVTVRIDGAGNATVELVNRGTIAKLTAFKDEASAKAALMKDFGFSAVSDGSATWTLDELNKAHAALSRLPSVDRTALHGVELIRDSTLVDDNGNPLSGRFDHKMQLAAGAAAPTRSEALRLADSAFSSDDISFIGGKTNAAVASFEIILHEAGHAVETKALRDAQFARLEATGKLNVANKKVTDAVNAFNPEMSAAFAKARKYTKPEQKSCRSFLNAVNAATSAIDTFAKGEDASKHAAREKAAAKAITVRDDRKAKLPAGHPAISDFAKMMSLQDDWFKAGQARAPVHSAFKQAEAKEAAVADPGNKARSKHLKDFVDMVNANKIPPLTDYAKKNWPSHPEEFFAEAYSLWLNDPDYLAANALPLKNWFDSGGHRA